MQRLHREPLWSETLTAPIAGRIPARLRAPTLAWIKTVHTAAFFSIAGLIVLFTWDGAWGRPRRRTAVAAVIALSESAIYASNNLVCPLSPLAEELGAESGSVTDIFLPDWLSRRIPIIFGSLLVIGVVLNVRAARARHRMSVP